MQALTRYELGVADVPHPSDNFRNQFGGGGGLTSHSQGRA